MPKGRRWFNRPRLGRFTLAMQTRPIILIALGNTIASAHNGSCRSKISRWKLIRREANGTSLFSSFWSRKSRPTGCHRSRPSSFARAKATRRNKVKRWRASPPHNSGEIDGWSLRRRRLTLDNLCEENTSNEQVCKACFRSFLEKLRVARVSSINLKGCERVVCFQGFLVFVFDK